MVSSDSSASDGMKSLNDQSLVLDYDAYLLNTVSKRNYEVKMRRLPNTVINRWTGKVPHWRDIDPYSGLEDEGSDSSTDHISKQCTDTDSDVSDVIDTTASGRELRPCRRHYATERPCRTTSKDHFYRGLCTDKPKQSISSGICSLSLIEPSAERQRAWDFNLRPRPAPSHTYPIIPEKSKQKDNNDKDTESDPETVLYEAPASIDDEPAPKPDSPDVSYKKGKFLTKTFGVKKLTESEPKAPKRQRRYTCSGPSCKEVFSNMSLLNQHFKASHDPVNCNECGLSFNTPSTLSHHMYTHHELKFSCDHCDKIFPFASDRDVHAIQHESKRKYRCKKCSKSFFMKGDLKKHEEVHKNIIVKCSLCDYETTDV